MSVNRIGSFNLSKVDKTVSFILDTNILYFVHSGYYSNTYFKNIIYSNLLQQIMIKGNDLFVTSLNLQELIFGIENKEYELYLNVTGKTRKFTKKDFRRDTSLRTSVQSKVKVVLMEIESAYKFCDIDVTTKSVESFVDDYLKYLYDPMDYLVVDATNKKEIIYITDDTDFQSDSRVEVLTI